MINILFIVDEIFTGKINSVKANNEGILEVFKRKIRQSETKILWTTRYYMTELESEESAAQRTNQIGQGLKILTPNQMLSRLPIFLAQLKAGNNSQKLKNEIRQLLYSLYRSKKLTKQLYKSLIDII